jgi:hypothetical protein
MLPILLMQIARQIRIGERPPVPPLEELPGPAAASVPGLNAYIALMRRCWDPRAEARPSFVEVAAELRCAGLLKGLLPLVASLHAAAESAPFQVRAI